MFRNGEAKGRRSELAGGGKVGRPWRLEGTADVGREGSLAQMLIHSESRMEGFAGDANPWQIVE